MKRKIILSLLALFIVSTVGAAITILYIRNTTATLNRLVKLHQIEDLRQHLIISIQTVQSDLYTVNTSLGPKLDLITDNMELLDRTARNCSSCHHEPRITRQIEELQALLLGYQDALSYYITVSANIQLINKLKVEAAAIGNTLLSKTGEMSIQASSKLETTTLDAMNKIQQAWRILSLSMALTLVFGILVAVNLTASITRPISTLVEATRMIAAGDLGYRIRIPDQNEFGELATHFNAMSTALRDSYAKLEDEIAERKLTGAALVKSERFLSTIFHSIRDPFCIIDREYRIVQANEAYAQMKRLRLDELLHTCCFEILYQQQSPCADCIIHRTITSGDPCAKDKRVMAQDGHLMWLEIFTYPIFQENGEVSHVIQYTRDITERKRTEEALRESEQRYALAARAANDGLWDWDLRTNTIYFSWRWKSMLGYDDQEISADPEEWMKRIHPDDRPPLEAMIATHLSSGNSQFEGEFRIRHKNGNYCWMLNRGLAVRQPNGQAYRMVGSQTDITARKQAEEKLLYDAFHDALTGLPNRALFMDRLGHVIASSKRRPDTLYAVLFIDMDRFKVANDSLGHLVGDQLLIAVGKKLSSCLRPGDSVARLGGDEFAILLENISQAGDAVDIAERINQQLAHPLILQGNEIFAGASIGIALNGNDYSRPEQVLRDADIAMYQAKAKGGSCYEIYDTRMHAGIVARLQLEADLRKAVEHREFVLHYQPIMDLASHRLTGFEALVRWNHPRRGLISPLDFIPLAEETGLIVALGEWVIAQACQQLQRWQRQYPVTPPLKMSINISGKQFVRSDLIEMLRRILAETGIVADCLALEITESMLMESLETTVATLSTLREMGFHIHIDDFGTGYSSLSYLHRFPITALKIDRAFVEKISETGENQEIIRSIVSLAQSLNLEIIAEGIELNHQLASIKGLHCQYGQGYLFSRPMEPGAIERWMTLNSQAC